MADSEESPYPVLGSSIGSWLLYPFKWIAVIISFIVFVLTQGVSLFFRELGTMFSDLFSDFKNMVARVGGWTFGFAMLIVVGIILVLTIVPNVATGISDGWLYAIMTIIMALIFYYIKSPAEDLFPFLKVGLTIDYSSSARVLELLLLGVIHLLWYVLSIVKDGVEYVLKQLIGEYVDKIRYIGVWPIVIGLTLITVIALIAYFGIYKPFGDQIAEGLFRQNTMYILAGALLGFLSIVYFVGSRFNMPGMFPRAAVFTFCLLLFLFTFQITKAEGAAKNNAIVFACLVLPIIPIFVLIFRTSSWFAHILSLIVYATIALVVIAINPGGMVSSESYDSGQVFFVTILCAFALVAVVLNLDFVKSEWGSFFSKFGLSFLAFGILAFGVGMVVNMFSSGQGKAPQNILLLVIILVAGAFLIFNLFKDVKFRQLISYVDYFSKFNFFLKLIAIIPCLIADLFTLIADRWAGYLLLLIELLLIIWYLFLSKPTYSKVRSDPNGKEVVREPIPLNREKIFPVDTFTYSYALSFWVNLKAMNPDSNPLATDFVNIVNYGNRPSLSYNASTNTLRVTMQTGKGKKVTIPGDDYRMTTLFNKAKEIIGEATKTQIVSTEENNDVLVADFADVDLQKWTHFVFYYNDGKLDIFKNGELLHTSKVAATNENAVLSVGEPGGNKGQLCSLFFFQTKKSADDALFLGGGAITSTKIKSLYMDFKGKNPPVIQRVFDVDTS